MKSLKAIKSKDIYFVLTREEYRKCFSNYMTTINRNIDFSNIIIICRGCVVYGDLILDIHNCFYIEGKYDSYDSDDLVFAFDGKLSNIYTTLGRWICKEAVNYFFYKETMEIKCIDYSKSLEKILLNNSKLFMSIIENQPSVNYKILAKC